MLSPGQVVYREWLPDQDMAVPWDELTGEEKAAFERIGQKVLDFYAEPKLLLDQRITRLEKFASDVSQEIQIKGKWRHFKEES